jgi:cobalt-zinc-cadmium efflux system outer membrane protein
MVLALTIGGCEAPSLVVAPESTSSDRELPRRPWTPELRPVPGAIGRPPYAYALTLGAAVARVVDHDPAIKAAFLEMEAKHGEAAQAAVRPNPELALEVENFAGNKTTRGFETAEETLSISQTIELGDKRLRRLRAAHLETSLAGWDFEAARLKAALEAAQAFVDVLAAQERLKVLREFVSVADKTRESVAARVDGGRASPIELDRAIVAVARARAQARGEEARLDTARRKLAALWGSDRPDFGRATGRLGRSRAVPSIERVKAYLEQNPNLARWADGIGHRVAVLDVEKSKAIRDAKLSAGVRRFNEDNSLAAVAAVSVPLQVFDRNKGAIAAAERRVAKAEFEEKAARNQLVAALVETLGAVRVAATLLAELEREVLPAAQRAFERTQLGYSEGRFDILNVLDAQRSVFEARLDVLTAQAEYEKARVQVEALIGRALNGL